MKDIIGNTVENEAERTKTARIHQGWWRAFVLGEPAGEWPHKPGKTICNTAPYAKEFSGNFLSPEIWKLVNEIVAERNAASPGMVQEKRLKTNLLSSQPLSFNFFGIFHQDKKLAKEILQKFYPEISEVKRVFFEYAPTPKEEYTNDNSAFDVAIEVVIGGKTGLLGIECKYTEPFSQKEYSQKRYQEIYEKSNAFSAPYSDFITPKFNQLFRNQLIAESLMQHKNYPFVLTALFCAPEDMKAIETGESFAKHLNSNNSNFQVITYYDFIERFQQIHITPKQREYSMLLWARYMGYSLSQKSRNEYSIK